MCCPIINSIYFYYFSRLTTFFCVLLISLQPNDPNLDSNPNKPTETAQAGRSTEDERSQRDVVVAKQNRTSSTSVGHKCCRFIEIPMAPGQTQPTIQCGCSVALGLKETTTADNHAEEEEGVEEPFCDVQEAEVNAETTVQFDSSYTVEDDDDVRVALDYAAEDDDDDRVALDYVLHADWRKMLLPGRLGLDEDTYSRIEELLIGAFENFEELNKNLTVVSITRPSGGLINPDGHNLCYVNS